ncbi:acetyl-CoA acetyltransferase [Leucobacter exalbidus]|uniref:Acetyl-CoA acetyltransferase n=1 Tax=Leucobacter exalbidus TaxID=662960 RepID=A0A940PXP9_9MICO|nr:thiolase family protein [Leucobacter exalbidus]MBP1327279.1 acetyl-CoA acetyltransferase [Leucobacter exalbidus]
MIDGIDVVTPNHLAERLGARSRLAWSSSTLNMVTYSLIDAVAAISSGLARTVIVYRALHVPQGSYVNFDSSLASGDDQHRAPYGFSSPPAWAGTVMQRYFELYGYKREDFAPYIVANRANAQKNPHAYWRDTALTSEKYLGAKMIADPMSILDCDIPVNGAVALVLTSTEIARTAGGTPALISAVASTSMSGPGGVPMNLEHMRAGAQHLGERLFAGAGVTIKDIDTAQLYDGFSILVPLWAEGVGLAATGGGLAFLRDGEAQLGGATPVNTGGGALGEGRLHGMTQILEAVIQVTDQGGMRQVPGALHSLATVSNGVAGSAAFIISRDA